MNLYINGEKQEGIPQEEIERLQKKYNWKKGKPLKLRRNTARLRAVEGETSNGSAIPKGHYLYPTRIVRLDFKKSRPDGGADRIQLSNKEAEYNPRTNSWNLKTADTLPLSGERYFEFPNDLFVVWALDTCSPLIRGGERQGTEKQQLFYFENKEADAQQYIEQLSVVSDARSVILSMNTRAQLVAVYQNVFGGTVSEDITDVMLKQHISQALDSDSSRDKVIKAVMGDINEVKTLVAQYIASGVIKSDGDDGVLYVNEKGKEESLASIPIDDVLGITTFLLKNSALKKKLHKAFTQVQSVAA